MIAYWPQGITTKKGSFNGHVGHVMDFMSTLVELSGATYPASYKGHTIPATTGLSLVPSFSGQQNKGHRTLFNEHFGARYAREGDWKLVSGSGRDSAWRLFNLSTDHTETVDLAAQYPDKVKHIDSLWRQWANTHHVFPKPGIRN